VVATVDGGSSDTIHVVGSGSGYAAQLGQFTVDDEGTIDLLTLEFAGSYTLTASNGDTVSGLFAGYLLPDLSGFSTTGPLVEGSGRFEGVTGQVSFQGVVDLPTLTVMNTLTGTISTVGSP
jgi:hypothetical protein